MVQRGCRHPRSMWYIMFSTGNAERSKGRDASKPVLFVFMLHRHIHRTYLPEAIYFVTTNTRYRSSIFSIPEMARIVEQSIWWKNRRSQFNMFAYVVMPDHLHMLLQPTKDTISRIMQSIKSNATREINRSIDKPHSREHALSAMGTIMSSESFRWQQSFYDHIITDEEDFRIHLEYIRNNPVQAGLVQHAEDYPYLYIAPMIRCPFDASVLAA